MANYGIMRIEKRTRQSVYGLQIEANRTQKDHEAGRDFDNSDIDWEKTTNNIFIKKTVNWNKEITRQIKQLDLKERKGSIVILDALYTCSPEWLESHSKHELLEYFRDCLHFHIKEYCAGDKTRLINAVIHLDEKTPHLHVASIPIVEDEKGAHLSAKIIMGNRDDFRLRQDRFYNEVSSKYGMERGEQKRPEEIKAHTTKREWQLAEQESAINEIQFQKELLEFDVNELKSTRKYEKSKTDQLKEQKEAIQNEIAELQAKNNELQQKNEELYNYRYEEVERCKNLIEARENITAEIKKLSAMQNQLEESLNHNIGVVKSWKVETLNKMDSINSVIAEYADFSNEIEQRYSQEVMDYVLNALGDIPEDAPEMDFNTPTAAFTNYNGEEYDLEL